MKMDIELEQGYKKADINNIPAISSESIFDFVTRMATSGKTLSAASKAAKDVEYRIDYVQVKKSPDVNEVKGVVFSPDAKDDSPKYLVFLKFNEKKEEIQQALCEHCGHKEKGDKDSTCPHVIAFIFWLHRKTNDTDCLGIRTFWGSETEHLAEERACAMRIRDIFPCDELRMEADMESDNISDEDGQAFLNTILDEMEKIGLTDTAMYKHCRPVVDEFESVYIHHTMLDTGNNYVKDFKSFMIHMDDVAKQGIFDRLSEVSIFSYKSPLWQETQYCRLRCSLIHRVASRKDAKQDEEILDAIFCKEREYNIEEKRQLKQHKRFILKQTEKLENKTYRECGLLLNESYPYICASPDGITDDHIVEIKAPKTDEEFEKYLECKETIAPKYMAQIQIQMYMANVTKALYCVLSPTFDLNGALHYVWVQADMEYVASLLSAAEDYWKDVVFQKIARIYIDNH